MKKDIKDSGVDLTANSLPLDFIQRGFANSEDPKTLELRANNLSHGSRQTEITTIDSDSQREIKIHHHSNTSDFVVSLFFTKARGLPQRAKKVLRFIMTKITEQAFVNKKLIKESIQFNLQEVVDAGLYSSIESARKGIKLGIKPLIDLAIEGELKNKGKDKGDYKWVYGHLFRVAKIKNNICTVVLETANNWNFIINTFEIIPSYCYMLSNRTFDLVEAIFYYARINCKQIKKEGCFYLSLNLVAERLALPETSINPNRDIKKPIIGTVNELNKKESEKAVRNYELELIVDDNLSIKEWVDTGKLKITMLADFYDYYSEIADKRSSKIEQNFFELLEEQ